MYVLDANVLIEAKNRYYAFDFMPGFWRWLERVHQQGKACSIEAVRDELLVGNDELAEWARQHDTFFHPITQGTVRHFGQLSLWATQQNYTRAAINNFTANDADFLLIAHAMEHDDILVTNEQSQPHARRRILIPDACQANGVRTTDIFQMLRDTEAKFDLA